MLSKQVLDFDKKTKDATKWRAKVITSDTEPPRVEIHKKCTHHGDIGEISIEVMLGSDPTNKIEEGYVTIETKGAVKLSIMEASDLSIVLSEAAKVCMAAKGHEYGPNSDSSIRYE